MRLVCSWRTGERIFVYTKKLADEFPGSSRPPTDAEWHQLAINCLISHGKIRPGQEGDVIVALDPSGPK